MEWTVAVALAYMGAEGFQFCCGTVSRWFKGKQRQTNPKPGCNRKTFCRSLYFCLERSRLDKGLMPSDLAFSPDCNAHSLFLTWEETLM